MARSRDPLAALVTFAMTQPLPLVRQQLATLNTIVKTREANEKPQPGQVVVPRRPRTRAPQQPARPPAPPAAAVTTPAATSTAPPHDPTERTAGGTPRRRRGRPPAADKPTGAMPPLGQGTTAPAPVAQSSAARPAVPAEDVPAGEFPPQ